ncbi:nitroreductase [Paroceanicella profunda]|uniref:Putative NAD(P)H nitroreductase n=1 Tax=Paroceanicella profunda TaxID=2579971 RepID=A0A5B8FZF0_9RHOB|nr:nitroreductase [Paroceanicella profunda]QDL92022.1 nitroreductase [Paroceanicella profunda]
MPAPRPEVLDFLLTRRSHPARSLTAPAPDRAALEGLLTAAARTPDHGMLVPWRFMVFRGAALARLAGEAAARAIALGKPEADVEKVRGVFAAAPLIVGVVSAPQVSPKIPEVEQRLSAGAVCLSLVNAALADGWGASWITGWAAFDPEFCAAQGLAQGEYFAGLVHIGTGSVAPAERPRPDLAAITEWVEA